MGVYKWKDCLESIYPVSAQTAGEELDRIYRLHEGIRPEMVVDESRPADAPLHPVFEWDDARAAELYRTKQAAKLIRAVVIVEEEKLSDQQPIAVRAYVHAQKAYHPISVALHNEDMMAELLHSAYRDMSAFVQKYQTLTELSPVFQAIQKAQDDSKRDEEV